MWFWTWMRSVVLESTGIVDAAVPGGLEASVRLANHELG